MIPSPPPPPHLSPLKVNSVIEMSDDIDSIVWKYAKKCILRAKKSRNSTIG